MIDAALLGKEMSWHLLHYHILGYDQHPITPDMTVCDTSRPEEMLNPARSRHAYRIVQRSSGALTRVQVRTQLLPIPGISSDIVARTHRRMTRSVRLVRHACSPADTTDCAAVPVCSGTWAKNRDFAEFTGVGTFSADNRDVLGSVH